MNAYVTSFKSWRPWQRSLAAALVGFAALSLTRIIANTDGFTSGNTFIGTLAQAAPLLFAALGGLYSERAGIANIGLEGMMVLGTWGAGWAGWHWGPWAALLGGAVFGMLGGLLHALATVTFGIDQIVSGVAINFLAPGLTRFLSSEIFVGQGNGEGTISNSPSMSHGIGKFTVPGVADALKSIDDKRWFLVSDIAAALRAFVDSMAWSTLLVVLLVPFSIYLLWHTPFGLRLRSAGEKPSAAESLGVDVYRMKYIALAISGALAGLGGAWMAIDVRQYLQDQPGGRGFIGLAALIFGNWQPILVGLGALLFAYGLALQQVSGEGTRAVRALYLLLAVAFLALFAVGAIRRNLRQAVLLMVIGGGLLFFYLTVDNVNNQIVYVTPYVIVLVVITFSSARSRPPASVGQPYRRGQTT